MTTILYRDSVMYSDSRATVTKPNGDKFTQLAKDKILQGENSLLAGSGRTTEFLLAARCLADIDWSRKVPNSIRATSVNDNARMLHYYRKEDKRYLDFWTPTFSIAETLLYNPFKHTTVKKYKRRELCPDSDACIGSGNEWYNEATERYDDPYQQMLWMGLNDRGSDTRIVKYTFDNIEVIWDKEKFKEVREDFMKEKWLQAYDPIVITK